MSSGNVSTLNSAESYGIRIECADVASDLSISGGTIAAGNASSSDRAYAAGIVTSGACDGGLIVSGAQITSGVAEAGITQLFDVVPRDGGRCSR